MPTYEFRCRACGMTFTEQRPMIASGDPATCPSGHADTVRLLSMAGALIGSRDSGSGGPGSLPAAGPSRGTSAGPSGGCCGGGCCG